MERTSNNYDIHFVNGDYAILSDGIILKTITEIQYGTTNFEFTFTVADYSDGSTVLSNRPVINMGSNDFEVHSIPGRARFSINLQNAMFSGAMLLRVSSYKLSASLIMSPNQFCCSDFRLVGMLTVKKKPIDVSKLMIGAPVKHFDGTNIISFYLFVESEIVPGDDVNVQAHGYFNSATVGSDKVYHFILMLVGQDSENYVLTNHLTSYKGNDGIILE